MAPRIEQKITSLGLPASKSTATANSSDTFMNALSERFREATAQMKELPGIPGVFVIKPEQTLDSLNITNKIV